MSDTFFIGSVIVASLVLFIINSRQGMANPEDEIRQWADGNGFQIVSMRQRFWVPLYKSGRNTLFYRLTVKDASGAVQSCWFCCDRWRRKDDKHLEIIWDDQHAA